MNAIINRTNYDKNFYKLIAGQKLIKDPVSLFGSIAIVLCCYNGVTALIGGEYSIYTIINLILGLVLIPIACFVSPYKRNCKAYEKAMELTKNKPFIVEVKFSLDSLNMKNILSQSELHKYSEVKSINVKSNLIVININKGNPIYIDKGGFVENTYDDFKSFINRNSKIKIDE